MDVNLRKLYELSGLDSESFSVDIEETVSKLPYVKSVVVNHITSRAIVELISETPKEKVFRDISTIISNINKDILLKEIERNEPIEDLLPNNNSVEKEEIDLQTTERDYHTIYQEQYLNKRRIIQLLLGIALGICGIFVESNLNIIIYIVSFLLTGEVLLINSFKSFIKLKFLNQDVLIYLISIITFILGKYMDSILVLSIYQLLTHIKNHNYNKYKSWAMGIESIQCDAVNIRDINGGILKTHWSNIRVNDVIIIKPGEKIPTDGVVIRGTSQIDTSYITGESILIRVKERDEVSSGTINKTGILEIKATRLPEQSTASKVIETLKKSSNEKSSTEQFITKFSKTFAMGIGLIALILISLFPSIVGGTYIQWLYRGLTFLVLCTPWSLIISIPIVSLKGIEECFNNGILIKSKNVLEILNKTEVVAFDKAGTLTEGYYHVRKIVSKGFITEDMLLEYAAYAEFYSNHAIAKSIITSFKEISSTKVIDKSRIKSFEEIPGKGVKIYFGDRYIYAGNHKLMDQYEINYDCPNEVGTIIYLAINQNFVGYIIISDKVKETSPKAISDLKSAGVKTVIMVTGDNKKISDYVGIVLNIDEVYSELSIEEKASLIESLQTRSRNNSEIIFVNDGLLNDFILDKHYISTELNGVKSDLATNNSDILIMSDDPSKIAVAIKISKWVQGNIAKTIVLSVGIKILLLAIAGLGLASMWLTLSIEALLTFICVFSNTKTKNFSQL